DQGCEPVTGEGERGHLMAWWDLQSDHLRSRFLHRQLEQRAELPTDNFTRTVLGSRKNDVGCARPTRQPHHFVGTGGGGGSQGSGPGLDADRREAIECVRTLGPREREPQQLVRLNGRALRRERAGGPRLKAPARAWEGQ